MLRLSLYYCQIKMSFHGAKITVTMQQRQIIPDAKCRYNDIDGFCDVHALSSQMAVILGTFDCYIFSKHRSEQEAIKQVFCLIEILIIAETLKHLRQNDISDNDQVTIQQRI